MHNCSFPALAILLLFRYNHYKLFQYIIKIYCLDRFVEILIDVQNNGLIDTNHLYQVFKIALKNKKCFYCDQINGNSSHTK